MALYQGYTGGNINIDVSGGDGVNENGFTMKGDIEMDGNEVKGLGAPTDDTSAVTKKWVDDEIVRQAAVTIQPAGFTMTGDINMGNNKITGLKSDGSDFSEASSVQYVHTYSWNNYLASNGFNKMKGVLNAGGFEVQGLPTTTSRSDSAVSRFRMEEWTRGKYLPLDGSRSMTGNLRMDSKEIVTLGDPTTGKSAVHKDWVVGMLNRPVTKLDITGDIDMKNHKINNIGDPTSDRSAVSKRWVNTNFPSTSGFTMNGDISMGGNQISGLGDIQISPSNPHGADSYAASRKFVSDAVNGGRSKRETYSGLTLSDDLDMGNNEIIKLGSPTTDDSAVSKKWVTDHVSGSSISTSGFTMIGNIDMGGYSITGLKGGSEGDTAALSSKTLDTWGLQFLKRDGGVLASNLDANSFEITRVANPTTDESAVSKKWVTDHVSGSTINTGGFTMTGNIDMGGHTIEKVRLSSRNNPNRESVPNTGWVTDKFMSKVGGLVEGDIDMGDSSDIVNLRDPTNARDAVNKQWVTNNFSPIFPSGKYVVKKHHIVSQWLWGYRGVSSANTHYYAFCHDGIPPSWRTDTINNLTNINLETITIKSSSSILTDITNVNLELILRASIYVKQANGSFTQQKKDIILGTIDLSKLLHCYFLGTYLSDGRSTACWTFKGNSEFYIGDKVELVDNTLAWCIIVKPEQAMPTGKSMDMSFCWSLLYAGPRGG
jgi:hypothetical protein